MDWYKYFSWLDGEIGGRHLPINPAPLPGDINRNSRTIKPGEYFLPLKGENFDGHAFIKDALDRGAAGFFCDISKWHNLPPEILDRGLAVSSTLTAYQRIAQGWRNEQKNLKLLALTGSTGKTTVREMLTAILKVTATTLAPEGNYNNEIGVPYSLCQLNNEHQFAPLEFGARRPGDIDFLTRLARPNICALLNIGTAHIGVFGGAEKLAKTKLEIFTSSHSDVTCVANRDDPQVIAGALATGKKVISFGFDKSSDIRIKGSLLGATGNMHIELAIGGEDLEVELGSYHLHHPTNCAAAIAMAYAAGVPLASMREGLKNFAGIKGRFYQYDLNKMTLIDDTYNANPQSMEAGLLSLRQKFPDRNKIIILGDMLELGDLSASEHRKVGTFLSALLGPADLLITVGKESKEISNQVLQMGHPTTNVEHFDSTEELMTQIEQFMDLAKLVYLKGSNGVKLNKIVNYAIDRCK